MRRGEHVGGDVVRFAIRQQARFRLDRGPLIGLTAAFCAFALASTTVVGVTDDVTEHNGITRSDPGGLSFFVRHRTTGWIDAAKGLSQLGSIGVLVVLGVLAGVTLWLRRTPLAVAIAPLVSLCVGAGLAAIGKSVVGRPRPPVVTRLVTESEPSFPSGHTTDSTALFVALGLVLAIVAFRRFLLKAMAVLASCALAAAVGVSRLELGVHWPSDVVAGGALGVAVAIVVVCAAFILARVDARDERTGPMAAKFRVVARVLSARRLPARLV